MDIGEFKGRLEVFCFWEEVKSGGRGKEEELLVLISQELLGALDGQSWQVPINLMGEGAC